MDDLSVTQTGEVAGTPPFISPEQAEGKRVDQRTDLFSLGSVLYNMCTGLVPFRADSTIATLRRVCDGQHCPVRELNPDTPEWLAEIVDRLLQKDPDDRFQTVREVRGTFSARAPRRFATFLVASEARSGSRVRARAEEASHRPGEPDASPGMSPRACC